MNSTIQKMVACIFVTAVFLAASATAGVQTKLPAPDLRYRVEVVSVASGVEWRVALKMTGSAAGLTELELPAKWASRDDLEKGILDFQVAGENVVVEEISDIDDTIKLRRIHHKPGTALAIQYRVIRIGNSDPESQKDAYSPVLNASYFQVIGHGAWVVPRIERNKRLNIAIDWALPAGWSIANSFGVGKTSQAFNTSLQNFRHALYLAGDFRIRSFKVRNQPVYLAIRGDWGFFDENLADLTQRIFQMERDFWNDHSQPFFLVSVIPVGRPLDGPNIGGTALENAFAMFPAPRTQIKDLRHLLTHELLHNWNPARLGGSKEPEQLLYWWSEGVTDFYTQRLLLRSGLNSPEEFASAYSKLMKEYAQSKARNLPNQKIETDFWKDAEVGKLPYQRGMLFATVLDQSLREASNGKASLDDVMRDIFAAAKKPGAKPMDAALLNAAIAKRLGRSYAYEMNRYIENGETIELNDTALGPCFEKKMLAFRAYELGFDIEVTIARRKVAGVVPGSAAYEAGLRDGMTANGWSVFRGDTTRNVEMNVVDGETRKTIKFLPVSKAEIVTPQFYLRTGLDQKVLQNCGR